MRETEPMVTVSMPEAHEITELDKKNLVNIWMGKPLNAAKGEDALKIQLNDQTGDVEDIQNFIAASAVTKKMDVGAMVVNLRVDEGATVGKLTAVKQELRKADALNISYAAKATN